MRISAKEETMIYASNEVARLTRSSDGVLAGICAGLGRRFGVSPNVLRLLWLLSVLLLGTGVLLYAVLRWVVPREAQGGRGAQRRSGLPQRDRGARTASRKVEAGAESHGLPAQSGARRSEPARK